MSQYKSQIQNLFLSMVRKRHQPVEVVLNTGTTLRGKVKGYDQFSITLIFKDKAEVIYKSAILYITALPKKVRPYPGSGPGGDGPRRFAPSGPRPPRPGYGPGPRPGGPAPRPAPPPRPAPRPADDEDRDPPPPKRTPKMIIDVPPPRRPPRSS